MSATCVQIIAALSFSFIAEFYGIMGTDGNTSHALSAVTVPDRFVIIHAYITQRADVYTFTAADTFIGHMEFLIIYKKLIEKIVQLCEIGASGVVII